MSRAQRRSHAARTHTVSTRALTSHDAMPDTFQVPAFLTDLRSRFPALIPESTASDALAAQMEGDGLVYAECQHQQITVTRNFASALADDHETLIGVCQTCAVPVIATRFFSRPDEVEARPLTPAELRYEWSIAS